MPIEKALNFRNEADFTNLFLVPLLRRLGYSIVAEYHGQREFGKDLVFAEIDRFAEVAYHGLQSKYQDSISQSDSEKLIDDCRQAFRYPFRHPSTGAEHRITTFVVANAGNITDNARDNFFSAATNNEHGGNVRLFDGKSLLALDRWATVNRAEQVGETLSGLLVELRNNRSFMQHIGNRMTAYVEHNLSPYPIERLRVGATSHYVQKPLLATLIDTDQVNAYLLLMEAINVVIDHIAGYTPPEHKLQLAKDIQESLAKGIDLGDRLEATINSALSTLGPLAAI